MNYYVLYSMYDTKSLLYVVDGRCIYKREKSFISLRCACKLYYAAVWMWIGIFFTMEIGINVISKCISSLSICYYIQIHYIDL